VGTAARESRVPEMPRRKRGARLLTRKRRGYVKAAGFFRDHGIGNGEISVAAAAALLVHLPALLARAEKKGEWQEEGRGIRRSSMKARCKAVFARALVRIALDESPTNYVKDVVSFAAYPHM